MIFSMALESANRGLTPMRGLAVRWAFARLSASISQYFTRKLLVRLTRCDCLNRGVCKAATHSERNQRADTQQHGEIV